MSKKSEDVTILNFQDRNNNIFYNLNNLEMITTTPFKVSIYKNNLGEISIKELLDSIKLIINYELKKENKLYRIFELEFDLSDFKDIIFCEKCNHEIVLNTDKISTKFYLIEDREKKLIYFFSNSNSDIFEKIDKSFYFNVYPLLYHIRFKSFEIKKILDIISDKYKLEVLTGIAKRLHNGKKVNILFERDKPYSQMFDDVRKDNLWVDSIEIDTFAKLRINRKGIFQFNRDINFQFFLEEFIDELYNSFLKLKINKFENKNKDINKPENNYILLKTNNYGLNVLKEYDNFISFLKKTGRYYIIQNDDMHLITITNKLFSVSIDLMFVNNEEILLIPQTQTKDFFIDDIYELIYEYYGSNIEIENE